MNKLSLKQLYEIGATSVIECMIHDCEQFNIKGDLRFSGIVLFSPTRLSVNFEHFNCYTNKWISAFVPLPLQKETNELLFNNILQEIESIEELKPFIKYCY